MKWESAFLENIQNLWYQLQSERNNSLMLYYEAGRSFGDISGSSMFQDIDKLIVGILLMFLYVLMILSNRNWVEWRVCMIITRIIIFG